VAVRFHSIDGSSRAARRVDAGDATEAGAMKCIASTLRSLASV
jgi:hypothetical protein